MPPLADNHPPITQPARRRRRLLSVLILTLAAGCTKPTAAITIQSIGVNPSSGTIEVDKTMSLAAVVNGSNGKTLTDRTVTWSSGSPSVATVDASGTVRGVSPGASIITATSNGISGVGAITVIPKPVATVALSQTTGNVTVDATLALTATTKAADGSVLTGRTIVWTSSNTAVASVSQAGVVTGISAGSATISATSEGIAGTAAITVLPKPVASVVVTPAAQAIPVGGTIQLSATTRASDGVLLTGRTIAWASSNAAVAGVNAATGLVTGNSGGVATISATSEGVIGSTTVQVTVLLSGFWTGVNTISGGGVTIDYTLTEGAGGSVLGTSRWVVGATVFNGPVSGTHTGSTFSLTTTFPGFAPFTFTGTLDAASTTMTGVINGSGFINQAVTVRRTGAAVAAMSVPADDRIAVAGGTRSFLDEISGRPR